MLLSELLYPINAYEIIDIDKLQEIIELIAHRSAAITYTRVGFDRSFREPLFAKMLHFGVESKSIDVTESIDTFFVTEGKVRGLPMQLSEIMGVTRQSADKTIKAANIYEARNLAVATLKYLKRLEDV